MYTEDELENYNTYMDWVRLRIKYDVENGTTSDITLGHIRKLEGGEWLFEYKLKKKRRYKTIRLINFDAWTREQKTEERNRRIDELLDGLREDHKEQLIEGIKKINKL
jgi:DNA-binding MarR family transcriptional regulator